MIYRRSPHSSYTREHCFSTSFQTRTLDYEANSRSSITFLVLSFMVNLVVSFYFREKLIVLKEIGITLFHIEAKSLST